MNKIEMAMLLLLMTLSSISSAQESNKKEEKAQRKLEMQKQVEAMVYDTSFVFAAEIAYPQGGRSINISSDGYTVKFSPGRIVSYMPYYGRAYAGVAYGGDTGLKFDARPEGLKIEKTKKGYMITARAKGENDTFNLSLSVGAEGSASLSVTSNNRSSISYSGELIRVKQ